MAGFDPWAQTNQGLSNLTSTLGTLAQLKREHQQHADAAPLRELQMGQARASLAELNGKQAALTDQYGTTGQTDALPRALSFQAQEAQMKEQQKQMMEKQKFAFDGFTKIAEAVKSGLIPEAAAGPYYHNSMKSAGIDLDGSGVKLEFKRNGGYFSGPITADSLMMQNGKAVPYGGQGTISKARIVGQDTQTGKPIFEFDEHTTFEAAKPEPSQYKDRTRPEGAGTVFEESQDGGKTWKERSRGAKPAGGTGGGHGGTPGGKPLPAGTLTDLNEASQMVKTLKEAQGLASGVDTGPIMGRVQSAMQTVGAAPKEFTQMKQKIATVNNAMLKLRSGAAVTESEYQRFLQEMPTANDTETVRDTKFAAATQYMEDLLDGKIATFAEGGYRTPTGIAERSKPAGKPAVPKGKTLAPRTAADYMKKWGN
jgi:hypothetical protein